MKTINEFDLNLLRILTALDHTRHVGRASELLEMSQSGFSTALARLRRSLGDELFIRSGAGMRPTPRALTLIGTARALLDQVERDVLGSTLFDPLNAELTFRLSMPGVAEAAIIPKLIQHLSTYAPHAGVRISSPESGNLHESLASGEVELAIGYFPGLEKGAFFRQRLLEHGYACIVRKGHPLVGDGMTRAVFQSLGHAVVLTSVGYTAILDKAVEQAGIRRRVILSTTNYLNLAATIEHSDLVATVPISVAMDCAKSGGFEMLPLPFPSPSISIFQYWHRRTNKEASSQWLRVQLKSLFNPRTDPYAEQQRALYGTTRAHR
ncbi:transcriptional regulator, LysR family [Sphingobium chlorophenolicum L-1]|uniref:Transcriptional regulator, LysR family n=1 Tax=Sphingobium chlorophenolicum L-1 TaxID=690566 RepID=F6F2K9_SPHCR|nr:LysR family transcriptional regulator [Sphingobium chlorophenolicum]AEG50671.1 transcriptional regulator, LysR family [Sphingobium chlorophenolicum L-1]